MSNKKTFMDLFKSCFVFFLTFSILICSVSFRTRTLAASEDSKYKEFLDLRVKGYENLSIAEFKENSWKILSSHEKENQLLLDEVLSDFELYKLRFQDRDASFLRNVVVPLLGDGWLKYYGFGDVHRTIDTNTRGSAHIKFNVNVNDTTTTVAEYESVYWNLAKVVENLLNNSNPEDLKNQNQTKKLIEEAVRSQVNSINKNGEIAVKITYISYFVEDISTIVNNNSTTMPISVLVGKKTAKSDFNLQSVLALRTPNYSSKALFDYRTELSNAFQNDSQLHMKAQELIQTALYQPKTLNVTPDQLVFLNITLPATIRETEYHLNKKVKPYIQGDMKAIVKEKDGYEIIDNEITVKFKISYKIANEKTYTVAKRDKVLNNIMNGMETYISDLFSNNKVISNYADKIEAELKRLISVNNSSQMILTVDNFGI